MEFYIVDAFTKEAFGGNPAGVVICSEPLSTDIMQKIAAEVRFSETAFIRIVDDKSFEVKFFTPNSEVDLCGHATISAFEVLLRKKIVKPLCTYTMHALAGKLPIYINENSIMMEQAKPEAKAASLDIKEICDTLNLSLDEIGDLRYDIRAEIISTGLWDIIFPVKTNEILNRITPDFDKLSSLSEKYNVVGLHAFTLDSGSSTAACRNFAPLYGINEEAATGTSNGALTYYLYKNKIIGANADVENHFLQGEKMRRPSVITSKLLLHNEEIKILVGGTSKILMKGEFYI